MIDVVEFRFDLPSPATRVWVVRETLERAADNPRDPPVSFWEKLSILSRDGFTVEHGKLKAGLETQGKGVVRFGIRASNWRMYGFMVGRNEFVSPVRLYKKKGQDRGRQGDELVALCAQIRDSGKWRRILDE